MYPTDEQLIDDFKKLIKIHNLRLSLFHKLEELKLSFKEQLEEYRDIETVIEPEQEKNKKNSLKQVEFEIEKVDQEWVISSPDNPLNIKIIPPEILEYITDYDINPGIIHMINDFNTKNGKIFNFSFEKLTEDCLSCSITEKTSGKSAKKEIPTQFRDIGDTTNKAEELKQLLTYLMNCESFYNYINKEFRTNWQPLIDTGCVQESC